MNHQPRNKSIYTDQGKAEIFFQTINLDHYLTKYLSDLNKPDDKRFHRLTFGQITKALSQGNVFIDNFADSQNRCFAISLYEGRYYYAVFYLEKRDDCAKLFAVIVTCYATKTSINGMTTGSEKPKPDSNDKLGIDEPYLNSNPLSGFFRYKGKMYRYSEQGEMVRFYPPGLRKPRTKSKPTV